MEENKNMSAVIDEIKGADEESLKKVIEDWFESTRTAGMRVGATYIAAAVYDTIVKNLKRGSQSSLRDYQRAIKRIIEIVSVQLKQETIQNDLEEVVEEEANDGTAE